ncbi:MAG: DUF2029 domain-containing protein [Deltaproteobacteria bacterium]|nr:DUF2029 domain-containing protein [Deltaproteobacteria bacterium]
MTGPLPSPVPRDRLRGLKHALAWTLTLLAVAWAAWAILGLVGDLASRPPGYRDFLPLWLGGRALLDGRDPTDPAVLAALFDATRPSRPPGAFLTYYPQSAAMLCIPLSLLDFRVLGRGLQAALGIALLAGPALAAASTNRGMRLVAAMAVAAGIAASLPIAWVVVNMGQCNAIMVLLTGLGIWALARDRPVVGGLAIGLGIALKLFPVVLLVPAILGRRWRLVAIALTLPILVFLSSLPLYAGPWAGSPMGSDALSWLVQPLRPQWSPDVSPLVRALWHARLWVPGGLAVGLTAWGTLRREPKALAPLAALWLAWISATIIASQAPHYAILLLPAVGWIVGWSPSARRPWLAGAALLLLAVAAWQGGIFVGHRARTLQWLPVSFAVVLGCAAGVVDRLLPARRGSNGTTRRGTSGA